MSEAGWEKRRRLEERERKREKRARQMEEVQDLAAQMEMFFVELLKVTRKNSKNYAASARVMFQALVDEGFTAEQAMTILTAQLGSLQVNKK